jgi:transposase
VAKWQGYAAKHIGTRLDEGPVKAGCSGAGWRSPRIQQLIYDRCGGFDHVCSMAQWLQNVGLSSQKAAVVSDHLDAHNRQGWRTTTWPQIRRRAKERQARRLWGDAVSCPPWGTRPSPWARRGQQPQGKTAGKRKGDNVFGLLASFTGHFCYQGQDGRLNAAASIAFRRRVLAPTTQPMILRQDGAKDQTSAETQALFVQQTARLQVVQLPTYAPDSNPIEKLWKKSKQQDTPLHYCPTFEALTEQVEQALRKLSHAPEAILALCSLPTA